MENHFERFGGEGGVNPEGPHLEQAPIGKKDERLSPKAALLYQEYATKVADKEFSEQADESSYQEAEQLINKLKDAKFDWLGLDFDKVDARDINKISEAERRLDFVIRQLAKKEKDGAGVLAGLAGKFKSAVIPIMVAMASLSAAEFPKDALADSVQIYKEGHLENNGTVKITAYQSRRSGEEKSIEDYRLENQVNLTSTVQKWLAENKEIAERIDSIAVETVSVGQDNPENSDASLFDEKRIVIADAPLSDGQMVTNTYAVWSAYAHPGKITVTTKNGEVFSAKDITKAYFARDIDPYGPDSAQNALNSVFGEAVANSLTDIKIQIETEGSNSQ